MQLNFRHVISNDILIYPGYVPVPGVNYRVFHYGLEFRVGNWSFDKAKWRHMDVVNTCWVKFPDPPDPSTLDRSNKELFQRDSLSIECAKTLNEALDRHYARKKCPDPNTLSTPSRETLSPPSLFVPTKTRTSPPSLVVPTKRTLNPPTMLSPDRKTPSEITVSRKFGKVEEIDSSKEVKNESKKETHGLSPPAEGNQAFGTMRFWIIWLWGCSIVGFGVVMFMMMFNRRGQRKRGKTYKSKRRSTWDRSSEIL